MLPSNALLTALSCLALTGGLSLAPVAQDAAVESAAAAAPARMDPVSLLESARTNAAAVGIQIIIPSDALGMLSNTSAPSVLEFPDPEKRWQLTQEALFTNDCGFVEWSDEPRVLGLVYLAMGRGTPISCVPSFVKPEEVPQFSDRPGHMITTVIDVKNLDVRQLSNSLRAMASGTHIKFLPAGNSDGMVLSGRAKEVNALIQMISAIDEVGGLSLQRMQAQSQALIETSEE